MSVVVPVKEKLCVTVNVCDTVGLGVSDSEIDEVSEIVGVPVQDRESDVVSESEVEDV